jgi:hypothetical protein
MRKAIDKCWCLPQGYSSKTAILLVAHGSHRHLPEARMSRWVYRITLPDRHFSHLDWMLRAGSNIWSILR